MEDRFVEKTDVDADRINDPDRSIDYARDLLRESLTRNAQYLDAIIEDVGEQWIGYPDVFIDSPTTSRHDRAVNAVHQT